MINLKLSDKEAKTLNKYLKNSGNPTISSVNDTLTGLLKFMYDEEIRKDGLMTVKEVEKRFTVDILKKAAKYYLKHNRELTIYEYKDFLKLDLEAVVKDVIDIMDHTIYHDKYGLDKVNLELLICRFGEGMTITQIKKTYNVFTTDQIRDYMQSEFGRIFYICCEDDLKKKSNYVTLHPTANFKTRLYGRSEGILNWNRLDTLKYIKQGEKAVVVIPERFEGISSSFVQGFVQTYVKNYGYDELQKNIRIKSKRPGIEEQFWSNLF